MWLIRKDVIEAVEHARAKGLAAPAGAVEAFERRNTEAASTGEPRIFRRAGDVAEIRVDGVLTPKPDFYAYYYGNGNTTYPEIIQSLQIAGADPTIKRVVLSIASPGGYVSGLFDVLAALEVFSKPKETIASQADSAAYAIAAMGGKITAPNDASEFGSIGVCATYVKYDYEEVIDITSSNAPNKRPDPGTDEGKAVIRKYLDDIEDLFVSAIAKGRGTTAEVVTSTFGRGAVMLATEAKKLKLIDKITKAPGRALAESSEDASSIATAPVATADASAGATPPHDTPAPAPAPAVAQPAQPAVPLAPLQNASAASGGAPKRRQPMEETQFQAEHPALYTVVLNKGVAQGKSEAEKAAATASAEEKDRIEAHLKAGEESGDMKTALESIRSGAKMTSTLLTTYMMAGMRKGAIDARAEDDKVAAAATAGITAGSDKTKTKIELVAEAVERQAKGSDEDDAE